MRSSVLWIGLAAGSLLGACSNSPWSESLERSLAADPRLATNPVTFGAPSATSSPAPSPAPSPNDTNPTTAQLPANFPGEIPRYPDAQLLAVTQPGNATATQGGAATQMTETRWSTSASATQVQQFYQDRLQADGWQLTRSPNASPSSTPVPNASSSPSPSPASTTGELTAQRDGLRVAIATLPADGATQFTIRYQFQESGSVPASPSTTAPTAVQPGSPDFIGPIPPADWQAKPASPPPTANTTSLPFADLKQAPTELQQYVTDLANLGALRSPSEAGAATPNGQMFKPNQPITRREYARWLVTANNLIYVSQPSRQIRLAGTSETPAFADVPTSDPDFGAIQGLANAGLISSSLSGAPATTFRPNAALTREDMILWKVPVDIRRSLPTANLEAVQQTWSFQDAPKISPDALRAVLADHQNGDLANIRRAFGYTTLFQPQKTVTRAEAAAALWYFGAQGNGLSAKDALQSQQPATGG